MCQRAILAKAFLRSPHLLIADEPLTDIDPSARSGIQTLLIERFVQGPGTLLVATHDSLFLDQAGFKKVLMVRNGRVEEQGLAIWRQWVASEAAALVRSLAARSSSSEDSAAKESRRSLIEVPASPSSPAAFSYHSDSMPSVVLHQGLRFTKGRNVGIVGESGAGKSTLARLLARLLYGDQFRIEHPSLLKPSGPEYHLYRNLQLVFQDSAGTLNPDETVGKILEDTLASRRVPVSSDLIVDILSWMGLEGSEDKTPPELSMGMQRRFALLRAFAGVSSPRSESRSSARMVILDEVTRGLDPVSRTRLIQLLLHQGVLGALGIENLTFAIISHDLELISQTCHTVFVLFRGWLVEIADRPRLDAELKWRHPYSRHLFGPSRDLPDHDENDTVGTDTCPYLPYCELDGKGPGVCSPPTLRPHRSGSYMCIDDNPYPGLSEYGEELDQ